VFATAPDRAQYITMAVGTVKRVDFQLEFRDAWGDGWRIMFNPSKCPGDNLATMATVEKTAVDTWIFKASEYDVACLQFREGPHRDHLFKGMYSLPFEITAIAQ
jgi:hypothetical protein